MGFWDVFSPKVDLRSVLKMVTNKTSSGQRYPADGHTVEINQQLKKMETAYNLVNALP